MDDLTHRERSETILSTEWPKLNTKEEAILRIAITGNKLSSEEREMLLDVMLGLSHQQWQQSADYKRKSLDSATQGMVVYMFRSI